MVILIVTWLVFNQPPTTSQTNFSSMSACQVALSQIETAKTKIWSDILGEEADAARHGTILNRPFPELSAVCAAQ